MVGHSCFEDVTINNGFGKHIVLNLKVQSGWKSWLVSHQRWVVFSEGTSLHKSSVKFTAIMSDYANPSHKHKWKGNKSLKLCMYIYADSKIPQCFIIQFNAVQNLYCFLIFAYSVTVANKLWSSQSRARNSFSSVVVSDCGAVDKAHATDMTHCTAILELTSPSRPSVVCAYLYLNFLESFSVTSHVS